MNLTLILLIGGAGTLAGIIFGYFLRWLITLSQKGSMEVTIKQMMLEAKDQAQKITEKAEMEAETRLKEAKENEKEKDADLKKREERIVKKEDLLDKRQTDVDRETEELKHKAEELKQLKEKAVALDQTKREELERVAKLSHDAAKAELLSTAAKESEEDLLTRIRKLEAEAGNELERRAKNILASTIQRLAANNIPEVMSTTVPIPTDDLKGKIIGKEGRNIRAFEKATGVEVIIDDTPGAIVLSSFDPVRRHTAKVALEELLSDGRINPARIEEAVEKAKNNVAQTIKEKGEQAAYEASVFNLDPRILLILGRLHFRTSYGQNVLQHSIEMSHLAGMLAEELGADPQVARAGALLHDIGKAVDHEVPGTHVEIGIRILEKFGVSQDVIKAMRAHHEEYPYETIESIIVQVADAISGGRPGARRDSVENYLKRLKDLEDIANSFSGIEKAYAIQAGRELRVFVRPGDISDLETRRIAREIALRIEKELKYPGEIKITAIRESRATEYAR